MFKKKILILILAVIAASPVLSESPKAEDGNSLIPEYPVPFLAVARTPYKIDDFKSMNIQSKLGYLGGFSGFIDKDTGQIGFPGSNGWNSGLNVAFDNEKLVIQFGMPFPFGRKVRYEAKDKNGDLLSDDVFELLIQPRNSDGSPKGPVYRVIGNAGEVCKTNKDLPQVGQFQQTWEPENFKYCTMMWEPSKCWMGAIRIPFKELGGMPKNGDVWGVQCAFRYANPSITAYLSPTDDFKENYQRFAKLRFDCNRNVNVRPQIPETMKRHDFFMGCIFDNSLSQKIPVELKIELKDKDKIVGEKKLKKEVSANTFYEGMPKPVIIRSYPASLERKSTFAFIEIKDLKADTVIYRQYIPYWREDPNRMKNLKQYFANNFKFNIGPYPSTGAFEYDIDCRTLKEVNNDVEKLKLTVKLDGKKLKSEELGLAGGKLNGFIRISKKPAPLPDGKYEITAEIIGKNGKAAATKTETFIRHTMPFEKTALQGQKDIIVPPFTAPVIENRTKACCILRKYVHGANSLLKQVNAGGENILSRPATLNLETGSGKTVKLTGRKFKLSPLGKGKISYRQTFFGKGVKLLLSGVMDYDGFYRFKAKLAPESQPVEIKKLYLEIPFKAKNAIQISGTGKFNWDPSKVNYEGDIEKKKGRIWDSKNSLFTGGAVRHGNMSPYLWVGDDERGLCYSCSSEKGMHNDDDLPALTLDREGEEVVLRAYFVNKPFELKSLRDFEFALQASPFKPMPKNHRLWRTIKKNDLKRATYQKNGRFHCGFDLKWTYPYGRFLDLAKMKEWADGLRGKTYDFIAVPASSCSECAGTPEYLQFWREWGSPMGFDKLNARPGYMVKILKELNLPVNNYVNVEAPSNTCSSNLKYRLWWFAECIRKGGVDHIYQDNQPYSYHYEPEAGWGYTRDDGKKEAESMIWNSREFMKSCANIVSQTGIKESPYVWPNMCGAPAPGRSFCKMALIGESPESDKLPLDHLRVWLSHQWGFNIQWLFQAPPKGASERYWRTLCSRLFLLDVTDFCRDCEEYWKWERALDVFWLDDPSVKWHPYYKNDLVKSKLRDETKVSSYTADGRALFVISNQSKTPICEEIEFQNLKKYGAGGLRYFYDAESGEEIENSNGRLKIYIKPDNYRLVLGMKAPFKFAAKNLFKNLKIPPQSSIDREVTLTELCRQLLKSCDLKPIHNGHKLTEARVKSIVHEITENPDDYVFFDAEKCRDIDIGDPKVEKSLIYNKKKNIFLACFYNPSSKAKLLNGSVRNNLTQVAGRKKLGYVLNPVSGSSNYHVLDLPPKTGKIEVYYPDHKDYWGKRKGPFKIGTEMSNMLDAVIAKRKEKEGAAALF